MADAARHARDGDVIEIDAGLYLNEFASWPQNNLTIRAVGGRARMVALAGGADGKAIWVIKGDNVLIENIEFSGARVPDQNGAGIRHEGGKLTVRNCLFEDNEIGLLTWNESSAELVVERSEFRKNGLKQEYKPGDWVGHQIYVGRIGRFTLRESYVHDGVSGHLVKSRARESYVINNRITDEAGGHAAYELEFPNGGIAIVIGNVVQQGTETANPTIISFGAETYFWPRNEIYLVNNTLVDDLPRSWMVSMGTAVATWVRNRLHYVDPTLPGDLPEGGNFLRVREGADRIKAVNNLLLGGGGMWLAGVGEYDANFQADWSDFVLAARYDYRLKESSPLVGKAVDPGDAKGISLRPEREYVHPLQSRAVVGVAYSPGAFQGLAP